MIGAIIGDVCGSLYEWNNIKTVEFNLISEQSHFTDDTVLTVAVADSILKNNNIVNSLKLWGLKYLNAGYGKSFLNWLLSETAKPYKSWGNGAAMRISPVAYAYRNLKEILTQAERYTVVTHNHPEGIKGAKAVATAIFLALSKKTKNEIKQTIEENFGYNLSRRLDDIRPFYTYHVSCQGSVPEAIIAFLESNSFSDSLKLAISLGGDSDTIACITGSISQAYYKKIDYELITFVRKKLPQEMLNVLDKFETQFCIEY